MMNRKPETSLQEDLAILGLLSGDARKALSEDAQDPGQASGAEGKGDDDGKEKDDDHDEDDKAAEKKPAFLQKKDDEDAKKDDEKKEMEYAEQLEAAWDVVRNYYKLSEAEDASLTVESLRTVVDAMAFLLDESWDSDGDKPTSKPDDLPGRGSKDNLFPPQEDPTSDSTGVMGASGGPLAHKKEGEKYGERGRTATGPKDKNKGVYAPRHQSQQTQAESLNSLVSELHSIKQAVQESGPSAEQLEISESLIDGFEAIRDTAKEVASRVKAELAESKDVQANDARHEVTAFFEGIFNDASDILSAIAEGNVEIADAAEDLNTLSADLKNGLAGLKDVA